MLTPLRFDLSFLFLFVYLVLIVISSFYMNVIRLFTRIALQDSIKINLKLHTLPCLENLKWNEVKITHSTTAPLI